MTETEVKVFSLRNSPINTERLRQSSFRKLSPLFPFSSMLGVVIVAYHSEKYLDACLEALFREVKAWGGEACVYIIDNAGDAKERDGVLLIQNQENVGFAKAANQGIRACLEAGCSEVMLLNPDTKMEEGSLGMMMSALRPSESGDCHTPRKGVRNDVGRPSDCFVVRLRRTPRNDVGIVQPLITLMSDPSRVNTWGNEKKWWGVGLGGFRREIQNKKFKMKNDIQYASGACMLVKREVFEQVGLLDERFFLYFEDSEFSERVREAGWSLLLASEAIVQHDYRVQRSIRKLGHFVKSWFQFVKMGKK